MNRIILSTVLVLSVFALASLCALAKEDAAGQSKDGVIKSVDVKAKTFVLQRDPRPLTFSVTEATVYTVDGKAAKMEETLKVDAQANVTYTRNGEERTATKVEVKTKKEK